MPAAGSPPGVLATEVSRADVTVAAPPAEIAAMTPTTIINDVAATAGHLRIRRLRACPPTECMILLSPSAMTNRRLDSSPLPELSFSEVNFRAASCTVDAMHLSPDYKK